MFKSLQTTIHAAVALLAISALGSGTAVAGTSNGNIAVSANSLATCVLAPSALPFGVYSGTAVSISANLAVTCTLVSTPFTITLNGGIAGTTSARLMTSGSNTLAYTLYTDSGHTTPWTTQGVAGTSSAISIITAVNIPVYAGLAAGLNVQSGAYTDTVVATVTF